MTAPEPPAGHPVSETRIGVRTSELDSFGHVNHAVYLNYFEHARFEALKRAGFPWDLLGERGWAIFVVRIEVDYLDSFNTIGISHARTFNIFIVD